MSNTIDILNKNLYKTTIKTPYGNKKLINADVIASGLIYKPIEKIMRDKVYPYYNNTHSNAYCGQYMMKLINQSKDIIRKELNGTKDDEIIFTGTGCSGAIVHAIHLLNLKDNKIYNKDNTVLIITIAEHHSNYLPWKHLNLPLEELKINDRGLIDIRQLEDILEKHKSKKHIISSLTAASNVTGVFQNVNKIAKLIHKYKGIALFDFAASAPYVKINIKKDEIDGLYISPHKFLGGPGTPGLLVINKKLLKNKIPFYPSGGTVRFVSKTKQIYSYNPETKETGGTPNILGSIKVGYVFAYKKLYLDFIIKKEQELVEYVEKHIRNIENIHILNPKDNLHRLPVFIIIFKDLHYNFVVSLFNDLYGIQTRGGVSCCSVLAQYLLHINCKRQQEIYKQIVSDKGVDKQYGWCRITFNYTMDKKTVNYIVKAIKYIAKHGKEYLNKYKYNKKKNLWFHIEN